jgi:anionic cell wall polymer biosynthesis LytR-Cps2A-Psr (LCP) family protein
MLSIPRDLLILIDEKGTKTKINEVYTRHLEGLKQSKEEAIKSLEAKVTQIT